MISCGGHCIQLCNILAFAVMPTFFMRWRAMCCKKNAHHHLANGDSTMKESTTMADPPKSGAHNLGHAHSPLPTNGPEILGPAANKHKQTPPHFYS